MNDIKKDFPIFSRLLNGNPYIYLDSAATAQKPQAMIDAVSNFYAHHYASVGRGMYSLAEQATQFYENARAKVAQLIGAHSSEIIFTSGATAGINFIASSWGQVHLQTGDEILLTQQEHHANLIPWQQLAQRTGAHIKFIPINADGTLDLTVLPSLLNARTKLVAVTHVSNALGITNDIGAIIMHAHAVGAKVLIDAAQSVAHQQLNMRELQADFLVFSGHKLYGPTGIGVLYIKKELQSVVPPYTFGGGMVFDVSFAQATWAQAPQRYEAGTPPIAQAIGLAAAINYLTETVDFPALKKQYAVLATQTIQGLQQLPGVTVLGPLQQLMQGSSVISFTVKDIHPHDVAAFLDARSIAVRAGHYCAQPLAQKLGIDGSVRVSFGVYTTSDDIERFLHVMRELLKL